MSHSRKLLISPGGSATLVLDCSSGKENEMFITGLPRTDRPENIEVIPAWDSVFPVPVVFHDDKITVLNGNCVSGRFEQTKHGFSVQKSEETKEYPVHLVSSTTRSHMMSLKLTAEAPFVATIRIPLTLQVTLNTAVIMVKSENGLNLVFNASTTIRSDLPSGPVNEVRVLKGDERFEPMARSMAFQAESAAPPSTPAPGFGVAEVILPSIAEVTPELQLVQQISFSSKILIIADPENYGDPTLYLDMKDRLGAQFSIPPSFVRVYTSEGIIGQRMLVHGLQSDESNYIALSSFRALDVSRDVEYSNTGRRMPIQIDVRIHNLSTSPIEIHLLDPAEMRREGNHHMTSVRLDWDFMGPDRVFTRMEIEGGKMVYLKYVRQ